MRQKCVRNASEMRQKCVKMGLVLLGKEERPKCVRNPSKLRQKCVKNARNTFGGEHLLDDTEKCHCRTELGPPPQAQLRSVLSLIDWREGSMLGSLGSGSKRSAALLPATCRIRTSPGVRLQRPLKQSLRTRFRRAKWRLSAPPPGPKSPKIPRNTSPWPSGPPFPRRPGKTPGDFLAKVCSGLFRDPPQDFFGKGGLRAREPGVQGGGRVARPRLPRKRAPVARRKRLNMNHSPHRQELPTGLVAFSVNFRAK